MIKETVTMSHKELHRLQIIQEQAAARIGISIRQVKRLVQRYRNEGPSGLVSHRRGKRPNNSFSTEFRATVISLLKGRYADFGPTFACENLLKPITTGSLRRLVLLIMLILMCTILKRNWVISSAYRRSAFCLKISLSSTKAVRFRYAVRAGDIDLGIRLLLYARTLTVKLTFCMTGKRWAGKSMLMARSLYHWMMKRVSMNEWIMPVLIYAQNTMLNLKLTIPGLRAERKVISKLSPRSYLKRSLIPIKKIETKIDSVECISIHRVDS